MTDSISAKLNSLKPQRKQRIMDLVAEADVDVAPWSVKQDGTPVLVPASNFSYCNEWAFGGSGQPSVLCVWHRDMTVSDGLIVYEDNLRQHALLLDQISIDRTKTDKMRSRARIQAVRARRFDLLLQRTFRPVKQPVRVVLLEGEPQANEELGADRSEVKFRELDSESWYVHGYSDDTGMLRLVRGVPLSDPTVLPLPAQAPPEFVDQFSMPPPSDRHETSGTVFIRSPAVRTAVLKRAKGVCEYCGQLGFKTASGSRYLETHHVVGLSEDGPDLEWNVVAVCPTDHRRAHYDEDCVAIRATLVALLVEKYPAAADALRILPTRKTPS